MLKELVEKICRREKISSSELVPLIDLDNPYDLFFGATKIREHFKGNKVFTCSIINAKSGMCSEDCAFCAQSKYHNTNISVYPLLSKHELVEKGMYMASMGANKFSFVTSGKKLSKKEIDTICEAAFLLREKTDLKLCASLGILDKDSAVSIKQAGISRYHHNLETARSFFKNICTTHDYDEDVMTIKVARKAGLEVCSGGIMGLGEEFSHRLELAEFLSHLDVDSIPINFLNPIKGTKLQNMPILPPLEALMCIAIFRFLNPEKDITICGGREVCLGDFQSWIFLAGANGIMIGNYLTTLGRDINDDLKMIKQLNLELC
ncbi:biotin synthase BioB [Desulfothermus sp.]